MNQRQEYELRRGNTIYQLDVTYVYANYPSDDEGCPIVPPNAPMTIVERAEILATWPDGSQPEDGHDHEYSGPDYPLLEPPMTEQEVRDFDEHLADLAIGSI